MLPNRRSANDTTSSRWRSSVTSVTSSCTDTRAPPARGRAGARRSVWCMGTFHQSACSATMAMVDGPVPPTTIGIEPNGTGSCRAPSTRKCVPWWSTGSPVQNFFTRVRVSDSRSSRWAGVGEPNPNVANSPGVEPDPMPSSNLPPDRWSSVTAWRASTAGCRKESHSTRWPSRSRSVAAASQVTVVRASYIGWSAAAGGYRWSITASPVKPAASAARARSTRASGDSRIWGRKRWNSTVLSAGAGCGRPWPGRSPPVPATVPATVPAHHGATAQSHRCRRGRATPQA